MANRHSWRKRADQMVLGPSGRVLSPEQGELVENDSPLGASDFFPTPVWVIDGLLEVCPPPRDAMVLEPAAGSGVVVQVLLDCGYRVGAVELRARAIPALRELCQTEWGNWLRIGADHAALRNLFGPLEQLAILTNPPFAIAREFTETALLTPARWVAMLLRVNVIASRPWGDIFMAWPDRDRGRAPGAISPPTTIVNLRRRPSFSGDGKTSMDGYAFFVWESGKVPIDIRPIG